ncbi:RnfABCDGE type electron transport complex subunit D, partial [Laribacter hongkongensis]
FGSFPDAMAFSVLMMNMAVPLIDRYTQPPVFGHKTARGRP